MSSDNKPLIDELLEAYNWKMRLEELGILGEVQDYIYRLCQDLSDQEQTTSGDSR